MTRLGAAVGTATLACAGLLAGCTGHGVNGSAGQGFVSGDGTYRLVKAADRKAPSAVEGTSLSGRKVSLADLRGRIVVVNIWGSWCSDCQAEAAGLSAAARDLAPKGVAFLGIDSRDPERASPRAYVRRFKLPYDSIYDPDGTTLLAFRDTLNPKAVPSTLVIDRQGRVAAVVQGQVTATTLKDLVEDVSQGRGSA